MSALGASNSNHGIPQVLQRLELVTNQLNQIQSQLESQQQQLTNLQEETIPCTPDRYRDGLCGEGNLPFDLVVSICGNLGGGVGIGGSYKLTSSTHIQGGVGWKEVVDVDLTIGADMPVAITPIPAVPIPIILPSEVAVGAEGSVGLGVDACIDGIKIPIGKNIARDRVLALITKLENGASQIQEALLDAIDDAYNTEAIATALQAREAFASLEVNSEDPLAVFTSDEVTQLVSLLPAGSRLSGLITDPGSMIPDINPLDFRLCEGFRNSPVLNEKMDAACAFVENQLPRFDVVAGAFDKVDDIESMMQDLPNAIEYIIQEVIPDVAPPSLPPLPPESRFCQRFPRLCRN